MAVSIASHLGTKLTTGVRKLRQPAKSIC